MRRSCLFAFVALLAALAVPGIAMADDDDGGSGGTANFTHGVASGDVTSSNAILWTRAVPTSGKPKVKVEVWRETSCGLSGRSFSKKVKPLASRDFTIKVDAKGLQADTQYCYRFTVGTSVSQTGHFKTAPKTHRHSHGFCDGHNGNGDDDDDGDDDNNNNCPLPTRPGSDVHITFSGDEDGTGGFPGFHGPFAVLAQAQAANPDFYVNNGDNIYSDGHHRTTGPATTLPEYRAAYQDVLTFPNLTNLRAATSQYGLMDDHEVLNDYDGQTVDPSRYANGRQAFLEYNPVRETGLPNDPSCAGKPLYRTYKWGADVEVFVLDERSCRSASVEGPPCNNDLGPTLPPSVRQTEPFFLFLTPNPPPGCVDAINDPSRTVLGPVQKTKFKNDLLASNAKFKFVLNEYAMQQWYALPYDRWEGYGAERSELLNFIRDNAIDNVVFLTTDHHATIQNEVVIDRYDDPDPIAYDFVTGPIGTETLQQEIVAAFGPLGLFAFTAILNEVGIDCRNLNKFSWGDVKYDADTVTTEIASRDELGAPILNSPGGQPCVRTLP